MPRLARLDARPPRLSSRWHAPDVVHHVIILGIGEKEGSPIKS